MTVVKPIDSGAIVIGAGAAGLFCAHLLGAMGGQVVVLEKNDRPGKKILISGGGRCNFTNLSVRPENFHSDNPHFCKSALARFRPEDFIALVKKHDIAFHEKHLGQLFCDHSSKDILEMLLRECAAAAVDIQCGVTVTDVKMNGDSFLVTSDDGRSWQARKLIIATGGLSYPRLGATDLGLRVARQFGHTVTETAPALVPLEWNTSDLALYAALAGIAVPAKVTCKKTSFTDDLLFTHTGLSGPALLKISTVWRKDIPLSIDFVPQINMVDYFLRLKAAGEKSLIKNILARHVPLRLAEHLCKIQDVTGALFELSDKVLRVFGDRLNHWRVTPETTSGFDKAEVMRGGVNTNEVSSQTMESILVPGLYFIGEVLDVTGDLGGYNFHWAWASASACAVRH